MKMNKLLSIIILSLMILSCLGAVSAKSYTYDWYLKGGETYKVSDLNHYYSSDCKHVIWNLYDMGLVSSRHFEWDGLGYIIPSECFFTVDEDAPTTEWMYKAHHEFWDGDDDYYNVHIVPKEFIYGWFIGGGLTYNVSDLPGYNDYAKSLIASQLEEKWYIIVNEHDDSGNIKSFSVPYGVGKSYRVDNELFEANYTVGKHVGDKDLYYVTCF
ncbi:MAG: hypothetical protein LBD03_01140 [Methanobrevibacter sp.]|jgi:hypothetical protein|nr:hypothetical protein [Candidatus Methanovirga procula]